MLHRVAVFSASPRSSLLTLKLELLLGLGISKSEEELDTIMVCQDTVIVLDDMLSNFSRFKSGGTLALITTRR